MDIRKLRAFTTLAETKNYGKASQQLFITQPALTKQIQALEKELGVLLFIRSRNGVQLTPVAKVLLPKTQALVYQLQEYRDFVLHTTKALSHKLAIGFGIAFIKKVPKWISQFRHEYPNAEISLEDKSSAMQISGLHDGTIQLAFMRIPVAPPLKSHFIVSDLLCLAVNKNSSWLHKFKNGQNYSLLQDIPIIKIHPQRGPGLDKQINAFLLHHGVTLSKLQQCDDIQTIMALASEDTGIAIVPESSRWFSNENIEFISLQGPYTRWDTGMVWNPTYENATRDLFIEMVKKGDIEN